MLNVRVIAYKTGKQSLSSNFLKYINNLTTEAHNFKGFLKSNSYREYEINLDNIRTISISDWESKQSWDNWVKSEKRKDIFNKYSNDIIDEKFTILLKNNNSDDIFLL